MADSFEFKITGLDALLGKLESIQYETKFKGGRFALRKAAQVIREAAKQNAMQLDDDGTGRSIAQNIVERWSSKRFKATGDLGFRVGVAGRAVTQKSNPDQGAGSPTPHWRLLEFGTSKMRARPFLRPALEQNTGAATDEFVNQYGKAIDRAIKRGKKTGALV